VNSRTFEFREVIAERGHELEEVVRMAESDWSWQSFLDNVVSSMEVYDKVQQLILDEQWKILGEFVLLKNKLITIELRCFALYLVLAIAPEFSEKTVDFLKKNLTSKNISLVLGYITVIYGFFEEGEKQDFLSKIHEFSLSLLGSVDDYTEASLKQTVKKLTA
jgi:hypothetical protein